MKNDTCKKLHTLAGLLGTVANLLKQSTINSSNKQVEINLRLNLAVTGDSDKLTAYSEYGKGTF